MDIDAAIRKYKPDEIKILFIAEAPGKPDKHFYLANTNLFRTIFIAFKEVFGDFNSAEEFLIFFRFLGCYLDHLSLQPINKENMAERKAKRKENIPSLSERLKIYCPDTLIILMKGIATEVQDALTSSCINTITTQLVTSYPAGSEVNRQACIREITKTIRRVIHHYEDQ